MTAVEVEGLINTVLNGIQVMFLAFLAAKYRSNGSS